MQPLQVGRAVQRQNILKTFILKMKSENKFHHRVWSTINKAEKSTANTTQKPEKFINVSQSSKLEFTQSFFDIGIITSFFLRPVVK